MKLLLTLLIFLQSQQIVLFDANENAVGLISVAGNRMFIKVNNYPIETFTILDTYTRATAEFYHVQNIKAEGWVVVRDTMIVIELRVNNTYNYSETFYRQL